MKVWTFKQRQPRQADVKVFFGYTIPALPLVLPIFNLPHLWLFSLANLSDFHKPELEIKLKNVKTFGNVLIK